MSDRKEITKFLGNLLENQYFSGIGKYWAKEVKNGSEALAEFAEKSFCEFAEDIISPEDTF